MENTFYGPWDLAILGAGYPRPRDDYRSAFQIDRDRILYTSAFRRLQSKTQVFLSREYDFYRTRLTHSLEVAQIGRSICRYLSRPGNGVFTESFHPDPDLVEGICLAHDLGHPPFGHAGERTLHRLMEAHGGFEGNAQSLRLVTETIYTNPGRGTRDGINPTRAFLDGILKYKTLRAEKPGAPNHYLYDDQGPALEFVHGEHLADLRSLPAGRERNGSRSLECRIMDWADDTAYGLNDIVDSVDAGFLTIERVERWAEGQDLDEEESGWLRELLDSILRQRIEATLGRKIGTFITACRAVPSDHPAGATSQRYAHTIEVDPACAREAALYKRLALDVVFRSARLQQLDLKSDLLLGRLLELLFDTYLEPGGGRRPRILPSATEQLVQAADDSGQRARLLCDYVAGMTDSYAIRTYRRLFDPDFGSIVDLVR